MAEASPFGVTPRRQKASLLAAELAGRQWGVIGWQQLSDCGLSESTARRWRAAGKLHGIHRGIYALGHPSVPVEGLLVAALIHAGPDAALSYATAAWWWGLIEEQPSRIEVSGSSRARSLPGVLVHHPRQLERMSHRRFPITTVARTLIDFAATASLSRVRTALAQAEYRRLLDVQAVEAALRQGRPGTAKLRKALQRHQPRLALTRSPLENAFIPLCESAGIAVPEINVRIAGWTVDALWRRERLVVELDGYGNHHTRAQIERDRRKELCLRRAGLSVIRYSEEQVTEEAGLVLADVLARLSERRVSPTGSLV
jgi:predicted transcriptional regulator of viral defense system